MNREEVQQSRAWLHEHPPRTFETMDAETRQLYKRHMSIIKADLDAWAQQANPEGYAALLDEALYPYGNESF